MATGKTIQFTDLFSADISANIKALDETVKVLSQDLIKIQTEFKKGSGIKAFNTNIKKTVEITKDLTLLEKQKLRLDKQLKDSRTQAATDNAALNQTLKDQKRINTEDAKILNTKAGSMARLSIELAKNKRKYRELSDQQRNNTKVGGKLLKNIQQQDEKIKRLDKTLGNHQREVGNYGLALQGASMQMGVFGRIMPMVNTGLTLLKTGFKSLKVAIMSTGIGALVIALGAVVAYFNSSEQAASKFQRILVPFKILFGNLSDLAVKFGGAIVSVFEDPVQSIKDLWEAIKSNIVVRITSTIEMFGLLGTAIKQVFSGEFNAALESAGKATLKMADMFTGVEDSVMKATNAVKGFAEETAKETAQAQQLTDDKLKLQQDERAAMVSNAKLESQIAKLRLEAASRDTFSAQERIDKMDEGQALMNQILASEENMALRRLEFAKLEHSFSVSNAEDLREEAELEKALIDLQTANFLKLKRLEAEKQTAIRENIALNTTQKIAYVEANEAQDEAFAAFMEADQEEESIKLAEQIAVEGDAAKFTGDQKVDAAQKTAGELSKLAKKGSAEYKILKTAEAGIATYSAANAALASAPPPFSFILAAATIAMGLANVAKIQGFAEGTESVEGGIPGKDSVNALLMPHERVLTVDQNKPLLQMGVSNKDIPGLVAMGLQSNQDGLQSSHLLQLQLAEQIKLNEGIRNIDNVWMDKDGNRVMQNKTSKKTFVN